MTAYEKELLALAVEKGGGFVTIETVPYGWLVNDGSEQWHASNVLAEALTALLRDLGVEVPERPSALDRTNASIRIEQMMDGGATAHEALRHVSKDSRLAVIALLEGGES